jgi:hypothetical protein
MVKYTTDNIKEGDHLHNIAYGYIASRTILGEYGDENGNKYIFSYSGEAIFPECSFCFEMVAQILYYFEKYGDDLETGKSKKIEGRENILTRHGRLIDDIRVKDRISGEVDFENLSYYWEKGFLYLIKDYDMKNAIKLSQIQKKP